MRLFLKHTLLVITLFINAVSVFASPLKSSTHKELSFTHSSYFTQSQNGKISQTHSYSQEATRRQQLRIENYNTNSPFKLASSRHNQRLIQMARATQQQFVVSFYSFSNVLYVRRNGGFYFHHLCKLLI